MKSRLKFVKKRNAELEAGDLSDAPSINLFCQDIIVKLF